MATFPQRGKPPVAWLLLAILFLTTAGSLMAETVTANLTSESSAPITESAYTARDKEIAISLGFTPEMGSELMVLNNTGLPFIHGKFSNLRQGQQVALNYGGIVYRYVANYYGGSGNDLVLVWQRRGLDAWGVNWSGQLGNGGDTDSLVPGEVDVSGVLAGKTVISVTRGDSFGMALCSNSMIASWGFNENGQLGNGSNASANLPVMVDFTGVMSGKIVTDISAGGDHTLALFADGTIAAWGVNSIGQLGNKSQETSNVPVLVNTAGALAGRKVVAVSAGNAHSLALGSDGAVFAWGLNLEGQSGLLNNEVFIDEPARVDSTGVLLGKMVIAVSAGANFSLALCSDGTVAGWGSNSMGQLGDGSFTGSASPVLVKTTGVLAGKKVVSVSAGGHHCLARCEDGTVVSWGENSLGQLGNNGKKNRNIPVLVNTSGVLSGKKVLSVVAGHDNSFACLSNGEIAAWGGGQSGELGNNSRMDSLVPVLVEKSGSLKSGKARLISASSGGVLAVSAIEPGNKLKSLTLGTGSLAPAFSPEILSYLVRVSTSKTSIAITPTAQDASRVKVDGTDVVSGSKTAAIPLREGLNVIPVQVVGADGVARVYNISIVRGGVVDLGFGSVEEIPMSAASVNLDGLTGNVSLGFAPAAGTNLTLVNNTGIDFISGEFANLVQGQQVELSHAGVIYKFVVNYFGGTGNDLVLEWAYRDIYGWGDRSAYQLGSDGYQTANPMPTAISKTGALSGKTAMKIAAGMDLSLVLCTDGKVVAFGKNYEGQLGDGTRTARLVPVAVNVTGPLSGKYVVDVSTGGNSSLALCADGTVVAWGYGGLGQMGNNTLADSYEPVPIDMSGVLSGKKVVSISAGFQHNLALCSDGTVVAWGRNHLGQLGDGSLNNSPVPVEVLKVGALAGKAVVAVQAGTSHSLALCSDGTVVAWGDNSSGQLGNGTTIASSQPVEIVRTGALQGKAMERVWTKGDFCLAMTVDGVLVAWGTNSQGQLGNGGTAAVTTPIIVNGSGVLSDKFMTAVTAGFAHSLVFCSDGTFAAWGNNYESVLGGGGVDSPFSVLPIAVTPLGALQGKPAMRIAASGSHNLVLAATPLSNDSTLSGLTVSSGILNRGVSPALKDYMVCVTPGTSSITVTPAVTEPHASLKVNGVAQPSGAVSSSIPLTNGAGVISIIVTAEDGSSCNYTIAVITATGVTASYSSASQVPVTYPALDATGLPLDLSLNYKPVAGTGLTVVDNTGSNFINGRFSNLAHGQEIVLTFDGISYRFIANYYGGDGNDLVLEWFRRSFAAWGGNASGQFGNGTSTSSKLPLGVNKVGLLSDKTVLSVSAGTSYNLALCSDGKVMAWGGNSVGQLGDGSNTTRTLPVAVATTGVLSGRSVIAVAAGYRHSLALCSDGTLAAWGENSYGQLGNGTTVSQNTPVAVDRTGVLSGRVVIAISAGQYHSMALCSDGTVATWGENSSAQLGDNSVINRNVPVLVERGGILAGKIVTRISAGYFHNLVLCSDGTLAAWGRNSSGRNLPQNPNSGGIPARLNMTAARLSASHGRVLDSPDKSAIASTGAPSASRRSRITTNPATDIAT